MAILTLITDTVHAFLCVLLILVVLSIRDNVLLE